MSVPELYKWASRARFILLNWITETFLNRLCSHEQGRFFVREAGAEEGRSQTHSAGVRLGVVVVSGDSCERANREREAPDYGQAHLLDI